MRLLSCHVENFGRLHDFSLDFCDGCNTVFEANGFGKSTLAAFIRVMFYGFLGETKRKGMENERKHFSAFSFLRKYLTSTEQSAHSSYALSTFHTAIPP